jgi:hypothetical protein
MSTISLSERRELVKQGIDILMGLFEMVEWQKPFPRKMATAKSEGSKMYCLKRPCQKIDGIICFVLLAHI